MDSAAQREFARRYGLEGRGAAPMPPPPVAEQAPVPPPDGGIPGGAPVPPPAAGDTNQVATLTITFRAVSLKSVSGQADADKGIAYAVLQELQNSPLFESDPQQTHTSSDVTNDELTGTFTFSIVARLKHPLKL
jgi:hypothetical protein